LLLLTVKANPSRRDHVADICPWRGLWLGAGMQCTVCWHRTAWHDGTYLCLPCLILLW